MTDLPARGENTIAPLGPHNVRAVHGYWEGGVARRAPAMADEFNISSHTVFFERTFCVMYVTVYVLICKSKVRADALAIDDGAVCLRSFRQAGVECRNYL
jgi:hypothetical protein